MSSNNSMVPDAEFSPMFPQDRREIPWKKYKFECLTLRYRHPLANTLPRLRVIPQGSRSLRNKNEKQL